LTSGGDLVFVGDVHLGHDDAHLEAFLSFLDGLRPTVGRLVFMGDLFNVWIGRRDLEQPHHRAVLERLEAMRRDGVVIRYIEGNRDYRIREAYVGRFLDDSTTDGIEESVAGQRLFAIHGDLANPNDRQYRTWRRVSRSSLAWLILGAIPRARRTRFVEGLEDRLREANLNFKQEFPEADVRAYAAGFLGRGYDAVILGHFHVEKDLEASPPSPPGRILVLPEWKESGRYLRVTARGGIRFESYPGRR
jgi:UDP-2,3-diacylglucosamine hydrolase